MTRLWIKDPLAIFADGAGSGVVVENGQIAELVPKGAKPEQPVGSIFDANRHVIVPGLINTHHHFYQTLTRAITPALGKPLFSWLHTLYPIWANLDPEMLAIATKLAAVELLLSGCTTASDHHYIYPPCLDRALDIQATVIKEIGIRATLTRGSMDLSVSNGGLPPDSVVQDKDTILADCERVIEAYHESRYGAMTQIALAPCSPFSVSGELMRETASLADRLNVRLHTHLAETQDENDYCRKRYGIRPLDYLEECGWLDSRTWLAHGIHFTSNEIRRLGRFGVGISHCPNSNMYLASGVCDARAIEDSGAPLGLGVDGSSSNDSSNLVEEIRQALLLQRIGHQSTAIQHTDVLRWATLGGARCLGRSDIGRIVPGLQADLALFCLDEFRYSGSHDPLAALVICGSHRADRVMIGGVWKVQDGHVVDLDIDLLMHQHTEAAKHLRQRAGMES